MTANDRRRKSSGRYRKYAVIGGVGAAAAIGIVLAVSFLLEPEGELAVDFERLGIEENLIADPEAPLVEVIPTTIVVQPEEVVAGSAVMVLANGFNPGDRVIVFLNDQAIETEPEIVTVDDFTRFSAEISIPPEVESGEYIITATDEIGNTASLGLTVVE